MRFHRPIVQTGAAAMAALLLVVLLARPAPSRMGALEAAFFLVGLLYTQLFEHAAHRFPMHRRIRFLEGIRLSHLKHHRVFHGARFRTPNAPELGLDAGSFWIFPLLLLGHYAVLFPFLRPEPLVAFLAAATLHYTTFEITHWFTHIEDNAFDRAIAKLPLVRDVRAQQIEHHRIHHELPEVAFNFNPPFLGDVLTGRMPKHAPALGYALPSPQRGAAPLPVPQPRPVEATVPEPTSKPAPIPAPAATPIRFWQRPAVWTAASAVAALAIVGGAVYLTRTVTEAQAEIKLG